MTRYDGMRLVTLPAMPKRSLETLSHTSLSVAHAVTHSPPDAAVVFNAANAPLLPVLRARGIPVATHVDGLEWQRDKWGAHGKRYYRLAESMAVRWSNALIADARGISDYYRDEFGVPTRLITYGAPQVVPDPSRVTVLGLTANRYHLVVARLEPENQVARIVEGFVSSSATMPLVVVGSAPYAAEYTRRIQATADDRVQLLGAVWDAELLDQLYANAYVYWHGHSVGGTNPSLLRALGAGTAINAYDVVFNREVAGSAARFWSTPEDVRREVELAEGSPDDVRIRSHNAQREAGRYDWDEVAAGYERLCQDLRKGMPCGEVLRSSGRRIRPAPR
jgi:glycosyltransferase involved in cell wall biosynthesis